MEEDGRWRCEICGHLNPQDSELCEQCGSAKEEGCYDIMDDSDEE
jgi:RNA polymerase subunit RPABC4/transcription elongation factor Spt4